MKYKGTIVSLVSARDFTDNQTEYEEWEILDATGERLKLQRHCGQGLGCFWTDFEII